MKLLTIFLSFFAVLAALIGPFLVVRAKEGTRHQIDPKPAEQVLRSSVTGYHWRHEEHEWMLVRESDGIVISTAYEGRFGCQVCVNGCAILLPDITTYYETCDWGKRAAEKWLSESLKGKS